MASGSNVTLEELDAPAEDHLHYPSTTEDDTINTLSLPAEGKPRAVQTDKLYVGNLPLEISLVDLHKSFKRFGDITDIQLPYNTGPGGRPRDTLSSRFQRKSFFHMRTLVDAVYRRMAIVNRLDSRRWGQTFTDAAKAQIKMDGALLAKRMIKVDFAHHDVKTTSSARSKRLKDNAQVTTLSMLKGNQAGRNTNEQIARAEAKLRELNRPGGSLPAHHASLPPKPPPTLNPSQISSHSRPLHRQGSSNPLPTLPLAPKPSHPPFKGQASPFSRPSATPPPLLRPPSSSSMAGASFTKKTSKLSGVKIGKRAKPVEREKP